MENNQEPEPLVDYSLIKRLIIGIGEVSEITGVPTRQIRYWEEKKIITSSSDGEGSTRRFDYFNVKKILLAKQFLDEGFTLNAAAKKADKKIQQLHHEFLKLESASANKYESN